MKAKDWFRERIFEKWLWEPEPLRVFVAVMIFIPVVWACVLYLFFGAGARFVLLFACFGPLFWIVYGTVGKKVENLRRSVPPDEGEPIHSLIVNGLMQSPGIAILKDDEIVLQPVVGERVAVRLSEIAFVREVRWFNGRRLWFKRGFWFSIPGRKRLGVAVPYSSATLWRKRLT